jgi:3-hydroxyisobutyrate dehydrogenase
VERGEGAIEPQPAPHNAGVSQRNVGVIGVGQMGLAMAGRLAERGHAVHVRDVCAEREAMAEQGGATSCPTAAALARRCEVVIVAVVDAAQTEEVLFGADGVTAGAAPGACVILCPTIAPESVEAFTTGLAASGLDWIEAPMSGGPARARAGTMSLMVACRDAAFERHAAVLGAIAEPVFHIGERAGDGARTKLVNNLLAAVNLAGAAEAIAVRLDGLGVDWIEAPMSGGPARARAGTMSLMVACRNAVFERHAAFLAELADPVFRLGERAGDGARTKLVNNLLAAINLVGAAEALALAERVGLDPARTLAVIERSSGQSWIGTDRLARALADDPAPRAHTTLLAKDSRLALAMAAAARGDPRLGALAAATFTEAVAAGHGDRDDSCLFELMRARRL